MVSVMPIVSGTDSSGCESTSGWRALSEQQRSGLHQSVQEFGFAALDDALNEDLVEKLRAEAARQREAAVTADVEKEIRFRAHMGTMGDTARRFLKSRATLDLLQEVFDDAFTLSDDASCFTYYDNGDCLGMHLDRPPMCVVTLIVYLHAVSPQPPAPDTGLVLRIYGRTKPTGEAPRLVIPTRAGGVVLGRGWETWHERPRLHEGEHVVALTACFSRGPR